METFNQPTVLSVCGDWDSDRDPSSSYQAPSQPTRQTLTEPQTPLPHQLEEQEIVWSQVKHAQATFWSLLYTYIYWNRQCILYE